jgi:hypothetical protein
MEFTKFEKLRLAIEEFGASPVVANIDKALMGKGIPVKGNIENIVVGEEGIFYIEGDVLTKVVIHIVDKNIDSKYAIKIKKFVQNKEFNLPELIKELHKYHLVNCEMIKRADREGWRKEKYHMSRKQNGEFYYRFIENNAVSTVKEHQQLLVCKNCLKVINLLLGKGYTTDDFDLDGFLSSAVQISHGLPKEGSYSDMCAPNVYQADWGEISKKYRELTNYQCQSSNCPMPDLSANNYHRYLHTHHVSQNKSNNNYSNLKALCIYCHATEPNHSQIKKTTDYINYTALRNLT